MSWVGQICARAYLGRCFPAVLACPSFFHKPASMNAFRPVSPFSSFSFFSFSSLAQIRVRLRQAGVDGQRSLKLRDRPGLVTQEA